MDGLLGTHRAFAVIGSLYNVLIGSFGGNTATAGGGAQVGGTYKEVTLSDAAVVMSYANKVMIVPGYGLAVAQAQHTCHELEKVLEEKGHDAYIQAHKAILAGDYQASLIACPIPEWANKFKG